LFSQAKCVGASAPKTLLDTLSMAASAQICWYCAAMTGRIQSTVEAKFTALLRLARIVPFRSVSSVKVAV